MSENIRIDAGVKRILINDGPEFLQFNPTDVTFVEKFYNVLGEFEDKMEEYKVKAEELDKITELDSVGLPINIKEKLEFVHEICKFTKGKIDYLFGDGTSQKVFGDADSLDMIQQFFSGLAPFVETEREKRIAKYKVKK